MDPVKLLFNLAPIVLVAGVVYLVARSNPRQRIAVGLGFAFPGAGHFYIGRKDRALAFAGIIVPLFLIGLILANFRCVSPFDRHPVWGLAQIPGGLMSGLTWLATSTLKIETENAYYNIGCLYAGTACLLNILALCDVWDLTGGPGKKVEAKAS